MKNRYKIAILVVALLAVAFYVFQLPHNRSVSSAVAQEGDKLPMTADGFVDYLELANRNLRENVTVDNNVVVDIVQIFGTQQQLPDEIKEDFLDLLGKPDVTNAGRYKDVRQWVGGQAIQDLDLEAIMETVDDCYSTPWSAVDHPLIADWLIEHDSHLDQIVRGSMKPHYFHPLCEQNKIVVGALLPYAQSAREMGRGLSLRAMNELARGNTKACLHDLAAIRRLGKLMDQGNTLVENLVGYAITGIAFEAEKQVLNSLANGTELSDEEIAKYREVIRETSKRDLLANTMRNGEGSFMRDCVQRLERGQTEYFTMVGQSSDDWTLHASSLLSPFTDWGVVFKKCEEHSERIAAALEIEDDQVRRRTLEDIETELEATEQRASRVGSSVFRLLAGARSRGDLTGDVIMAMFTPAVIQIDNARLRTVGLDMTDLGFALELYRRKHGEFPKNLDGLAPKFVAGIPLDRFVGTPIQFRRVENGYRIWNVGHNRINEQINNNGKLVEWGDESDAVLRRADDTYIDVRIDK